MPGLTSMPARREGRLVLILFFALAPFLLVAQEISDFSYRLVDAKIEVNYTLTGQATDRYDVALYSSLDEFTKPLSLVTGEVGKDITPGENKKVIWDAKTELGEFEGDLSLKLRARFIPFLTFHIEKGVKFKRAKEQLISWNLGSEENIKLELYQDNNKISAMGTAGSGAEYNWAIPKELKPGRNYRIKGSGSERFALSEPFSIKRRIPLILWAVPAVIIGGTVAIIIINANKPQKIPDPIGPN